MPIYEYQCECGARFESLESVSSVRALCAEDCRRAAHLDQPLRGAGQIVRLLSAAAIRGDGRHAQPTPTHSVMRRPRPGCEDCGDSSIAVGGDSSDP